MSIPVNLTRRITAAATTRAPIANKFSTAAAAAAAAAASPPCLLANTIRNNPKINNALSYRTSPPPQAQPHHVTRQITRQSSSHTHPTPTPTPTPTPSHNNPNHDPETTATYEPPPPPPPPEYFHHDYYSPYKPKRQWPPDMAKLSPKHQFRLERKYRRRAALKFARPKWVKGTKLVQWGMICFIVVYTVLFMDWDERGTPFDGIRERFFSSLNALFSPPPPSAIRKTEDGQSA